MQVLFRGSRCSGGGKREERRVKGGTGFLRGHRSLGDDPPQVVPNFDLFWCPRDGKQVANTFRYAAEVLGHSGRDQEEGGRYWVVLGISN